MKKVMLIALCVLVFAGLTLAQNPTYTQGAKGITGIDKLGAHQNGGRGCVGCHAPHSGARGNGGNAILDAAGKPVDTTDPDTGNYALWGQDLSPLYTLGTSLNFGDEGSFPISFASTFAANDERIVTGVMMCLSCHDGNIAKGAMMTNQAYEQQIGVLPTSYGTNKIPTLLGNDGTTAGNYENDHPIGPKATAGAVGLVNHTNADPTKWTDRVKLFPNGCKDPHDSTKYIDCILPNGADTKYVTFIKNYGSFNVTMSDSSDPLFAAGGRVNPLVIPTGAADASTAYVVCTTCHTPHSMYTFSGTVGVAGTLTSGQTLPSYFFLAAPYNPAAPIVDGKKASSATQFCRQCHFTGAGGSNEGSSINNVYTQY